uniref:Uncharacterized protein n=1 Tax=Mycena chlorophos TaxID=658473 RepID=A0ABQ0LKQ7_MYCCL|nr:predicted protein [Mycena chlorophos]
MLAESLEATKRNDKPLTERLVAMCSLDRVYGAWALKRSPSPLSASWRTLSPTDDTAATRNGKAPLVLASGTHFDSPCASSAILTKPSLLRFSCHALVAIFSVVLPRAVYECSRHFLESSLKPSDQSQRYEHPAMASGWGIAFLGPYPSSNIQRARRPSGQDRPVAGAEYDATWNVDETMPLTLGQDLTRAYRPSGQAGHTDLLPVQSIMPRRGTGLGSATAHVPDAACSHRQSVNVAFLRACGHPPDSFVVAGKPKKVVGDRTRRWNCRIVVQRSADDEGTFDEDVPGVFRGESANTCPTRSFTCSPSTNQTRLTNQLSVATNRGKRAIQL